MKNMSKSSDISKIKYSEFKKLPEATQKNYTSVLVSAMNKRIKRLGKTEIGRLSPTYQAYERRILEGKNGYYSVKGLTGDALYNRFEALSESLKKATSVREWKTLRNETLEKLNLTNISIDDEKAFWSMYRKFQEDETEYQQFKKEKSDMVLSHIANTFESQGYDYTENTKQKLMDWLKKEYEKTQQRQQQANRERESSIYTSIEDDEGI